MEALSGTLLTMAGVAFLIAALLRQNGAILILVGILALFAGIALLVVAGVLGTRELQGMG